MGNERTAVDYYGYLVRLNKALDEIKQLQREVEGLAGSSFKGNRIEVVDGHLATIRDLVGGTIVAAVANRPAT